MKKLFSFSITAISILLFASLTSQNKPTLVTAETPVAEVLLQLGDAPSSHLPDMNVPGVTANRGKDLVLRGSTLSPSGGKSQRISQHFVCTSCHNVERDEPDLSIVDPVNRLKYVAENGLPYLQGSALYGIVDRTSFYNGDYEKKYGDLVKPARNNLRQAIQLCATECSQGRWLEDWELESILAYLWTIDLKMGDLNLTDGDLKTIDAAVQGKSDKSLAKDKIKSSYLSGMPATFLDPPKDRVAGFSNIGDPDIGKQLYELSCLHCHENKRYSFFGLNESNLSLEFLDRHFPTYSRYSVYQVARYGTSPVPWKRAYMPQYTNEKMTPQMLEDLRTYIEQQAKKG